MKYYIACKSATFSLDYHVPESLSVYAYLMATFFSLYILAEWKVM
jgi:hypothetical protein